MSQENVEQVYRRGIVAVNRGDLEGFLATVHPDVEFTSLIAEAEGETFHGHDGVRQWWHEVVIPLGGLHGEPEEVRDLGDTVLVRVGATYRPRGRGAADDLERRPLPGPDGDLVAVLSHRGGGPQSRRAARLGSADAHRSPDQREADQGGSGEAHPARGEP